MENGQERLTKKEKRELKKQQEVEWQEHQKKTTFVKRMVLWAVVVLGIGGIVFGMARLGNSPSSSSTQSASLVDVISSADQFKGSKESKVILVEYSDLQCPACGYYYPVVKKLGEEFGDKIGIAYRHFPLPQHKNAKPAAYAAEAAAKQGKFWEMHNIIFDNQKKWSEDKNAKEVFSEYAKSIGLNMEQYNKDVDSQEVKDKVDSDYESGVRSKVDSTPTFFLNGEKIKNPANYDEFKKLIDEAIKNNP